MTVKKVLILGIVAMISPLSHAVDSCGGQVATGNPKVCCDAAGNSGGSYGNCVWWAWKKAYESGWPKATMSSAGDAYQWDDNYARPRPKLYTIITTPLNKSIDLKGAIAVREKSSTYPHGHVAFVEDVARDAKGNISGLKISEMNCGTYGYGVVTRSNISVNSFNEYIKINDLNGQLATNKSCTDGVVVATTGSPQNKVNLYWSDSCQTYWGSAISGIYGNKSIKISRGWDGKSYTSISTSTMVSSLTSPMVINSGSGQVCASGSFNGMTQTICK